MENTIFNVYVQMENQEQGERLLNACNKAGLVTEELSDRRYFHNNNTRVFSNWLMPISTYTQVTESEFIDLLKKHKL